jgi:F-type H+-transporting ATPase subunit b
MDLLIPGEGLILWQLIIFVLLVFLLSKLAWKPIINSLKDRERSIQDALDTAEKARLEMSQLRSDNERLLKEAREERERIMREAREAANRMREDYRRREGGHQYREAGGFERSAYPGIDVCYRHR